MGLFSLDKNNNWGQRTGSGKQKGHSEEWPQGVSGCIVSLADGISTTSTTYENKHRE
jgi:hypothetical protein